ncbi:MAG: glycosyltransferase, partial [Candidatus Saccharibacteria bacterium]|nr:glycosyltransferase [Microbacteriaceae bacterium]
MSQPVSVALCTRNGAQFIEAQLRSILNQSVQPHEVILSDDASTDDTVAIARAVMNDDSGPILTVIPNPIALGITANFEQAILACSGEFIALCDQDDVWHPHRLSRALQQFEAQPSLDLLFS